MYKRTVSGLFVAAVLVWHEALVAVTALFQPLNRSQLHGVGSDGLVGCVGHCRDGQFVTSKRDENYCFPDEKKHSFSEDSWMNGSGVCFNKERNVPQNMGFETYGLIETWDVGYVGNMAWRKFWHGVM